MVKCRQATVKANPLPNRYSIKVSENGIVSTRKLATGGRGTIISRSDGVGSSQPSQGATTTTGSNNNLETRTHKRPIFSHLTRLQHGVLRYRNVAESPTSVTAVGNTENDRRFVYVPAGYSLQNDQSLREILRTLGLANLPPLLIVTAATDGAVEETYNDDAPGVSEHNDVTLAGGSSAADCLLDDLTEDEERELLREKTHELLKSTVELCRETGAWLMPHRPRRVNGAAEILCSASSIHSETAPHTNKEAVIFGMIGLDEEDDKNGFTERITSHMVPVGSDIEAIADIPYDPNVRDNTPCPELTHLLLFQRRQEMRAFRERLLTQTPDVLLAFGKTTPYAKKCLFSTLVTKSPVALITHTSPEIDRVSGLLRHVHRELQKIQVGEIDPPPRGTATYAVSSDVVSAFATLPLPPLPELELADPELAAFLPIWPAGHDEERVILADPRKVGGMRFQQMLLRAVNAAFYIRQARTTAIQEASQILQSIQGAAEDAKERTELYQMSMVVATLAAVVASVLYAKIYGEDPPPSWENRNFYQIGLFLVTICIPFGIVYLKKLYDQHHQQWASTQKEAADLESTIASFRARPRTFGQATANAGPEPLDVFVSNVCTIRSRALLMNSKEEEGGDMVVGDSNEMVLSDGRASPSPDYDVEAPPVNESSPLLSSSPTNIPVPARLEDLAIRGSIHKWKKSRTPSWGDAISEAPAYDMQFLDLDSYQKKREDECPPTAEETKLGSHHQEQQLWTIEDYIDDRIHTAKEHTAERLNALEQRHKTMELIIKVVLGSTTVLALLSKQWVIPIVLGLSAAFVSSQDFRKYQRRVEQGESMIRQLDELVSWWDGLEVDEKIQTSNEDRLVQMAESIITAEVAFTY